MGAGGFDNLAINVPTNINGANAQIDISPTGTGHVHIKPSGTGGVEIAPTNAGTMNNMVIGGTTPLAGTFTDLRFNNTLSLAGSTGTAGYVVTSNGASAPTWQALPASGITITDDTTTNATRYLAFTSATSGSITGQNVASTKLQFNPSTGVLTATSFAGSGANLTGIITSLTAGTGISVSGSTINATGSTLNSQTSAYVLVAGDAGKSISITTGGVTVNNSVFSAGNIVTIYNNSGSSQTITQGAGMTLQWAGQTASTTGTRTLGLYSMASILFISSSVGVISGAGLT
jgi:hypothetical protein